MGNVRELRTECSRAPRAVLLLVALLASVPAAGNVPRTVVVPFTAEGEEAKDAQRLTGFLEAELETRDGQVRLIRPPAKEAPSKRLREEVLALFTQGQRQVAAGRSAGVATLQRGVARALEDPAHAPMEEMVEALIQIGVAKLRAGDERTARAAFEDAVRLAPAQTLRGRRYPAAVGREFDRVRARILRGPKAVLRMEGPAGAVAYLNDRRAGPVPATVRGVPFGRQVIRIEQADGSAWGQVLVVDEPDERVALMPPAEAERPTVPAQITSAELQALATYGEGLGADQVVFGRVRREGGALRAAAAVLEVSGGQATLLSEVSFAPDVNGAAGAALSLADQLVAVAASDAPRQRVEPPFSMFAPPPPMAVAVAPPPSPVPAPVSAPVQAVAAAPHIPTWAYAVAGVVVVGAAATAGVLYLNRPVTGTVSATW